jgi:hypothetical protein
VDEFTELVDFLKIQAHFAKNPSKNRRKIQTRPGPNFLPPSSFESLVENALFGF